MDKQFFDDLEYAYSKGFIDGIEVALGHELNNETKQIYLNTVRNQAQKIYASSFKGTTVGEKENETKEKEAPVNL